MYNDEDNVFVYEGVGVGALSDTSSSKRDV
jgi:hypothetical protein